MVANARQEFPPVDPMSFRMLIHTNWSIYDPFLETPEACKQYSFNQTSLPANDDIDLDRVKGVFLCILKINKLNYLKIL